MTEKLYFNGVNGATGDYGLSPLAVEAFAGRILGARYAQARQLRDLQRELARHTANDRKLLALVELLATDLVRALDRAAAGAPFDWHRETAGEVLSILLGEGAQPRFGDVSILAERLRQQPVETIVRIARLLSEGQGGILAQWLLAEEGPSMGALRSSLESRLDQTLAAIQRTYLSAEESADRDGGPVWATDLLRALGGAPVDSVRALPGAASIIGGVRALAQGLRANAPDHPALQQRLTTLGALDASATWREVISTLRGVLEDLVGSPVPVAWSAVRGALHAWIDDLRRTLTGQLGTVPWVDPTKLEEAGWAVVFPATMSEPRFRAISEALGPLLALRQAQAGELYRFYAGRDGYRPADTAAAFLHRPPRKAEAANPADPQSTGVPYYLMLIGSPEEIPFEFQYQLDVQYAVGRLDFGDDLVAYGNYAQNVVAAETTPPVTASHVVFFGVEHQGDEATRLSANHLVTPLYEHCQARAAAMPWRPLRVSPKKATKANLLKLLRLDPPPALLFTATHGLEFERGDARQAATQGALLCREWPGVPGEIPTDCYLAARDVTSAMNLRGMILFFFACYGLGTPQFDGYTRHEFREDAQAIAEQPFTAALPKAMLALRDRGALAVVGHIDRAWGLSFLSPMAARPEGVENRTQEHVEVFAAAIDRLLNGHPVGSALDYFNTRYAAITTELSYLYESITDPPSLEETYRLAELWTASNDARGYVVLGDPAVRLRTKAGGAG